MKTNLQPRGCIVAAAILVFANAFSAHAEESKTPTHFMFQAGSYAFAAETSRGNSEVSGFGAYSASAGLTLFPRFVFYGAISLLVSDGVSGDTATGYDLGTRYFWNGPSGRNSFSNPTLSYNLITKIRPYASLSIRQRQFTEVLSSSYIGPGIGLGLDYQIRGNWYVNGEASYSVLSGNADNTLKTLNFVFGLGLQL